jgi:multisubunit Na+/H+ antiporter MnhF subunit
MRSVESLLPRLAGAKAPPWWAIVLSIAACHGLFTLVAGVTLAPDSQAYAYWSARLVESGFDYPRLIEEASGGFPAILYALFGTLLAVLRLAFGNEWAGALVALNFLSHVALGLLVVRLAARLTGGGLAAWGALFLFLICFDLLMWVPFVLSDATFAFLAFLIFSLASARILGSAKGWLAVLAPAAAGIFYRPTGMVLIPDLAWAIFLSKTGSRAIRRGPVLAVLAAVIVVAAVVFAWIVQDPSRWPLDALSAAFRNTAADYALGEVVSARHETYHALPAALTDFLLISADRFAHFFAVGAAAYSRKHWLVELAFFLPCYFLAGWLALALWRGRTSFAAPERKVFLAAFGALLSYAVFHALVQVDFDWRYRTPILPHLILLAAGGLADLARRRAAR